MKSEHLNLSTPEAEPRLPAVEVISTPPKPQASPEPAPLARAIAMIPPSRIGYALCRDSPRDFYPTASQRQITAFAKEICGRCTIKQQCLDVALTNNEDEGIWGGLGEDERRALKRRNASRARRQA